MKTPRVLFLGQKPIGEACFQILLDASVVPVGLVTNHQKDRVWWKSAAIWEIAEELGIPLLDNDRRRTAELLALIQKTRPTVIISVQHQWILPAEVISSVPRAFNLHLAPLPAYKGYNCFNHAILNREKTYGVTLHHLIPEVDAGPIAYSARFDVAPNETAKSLYEKSLISGKGVFKALIQALISDELVPSVPPSGAEHFYARSSLDSMRETPADTSDEEKEIRARAFYFPPFPGAYIRDGEKKILLTPFSTT